MSLSTFEACETTMGAAEAIDDERMVHILRGLITILLQLKPNTTRIALPLT